MDSWSFPFLSVYHNFGVTQKVKSVKQNLIKTKWKHEALSDFIACSYQSNISCFSSSYSHSWLWNGSLELTSFFANCHKSMVRFSKSRKNKNVSRVYPGYWGETNRCCCYCRHCNRLTRWQDKVAPKKWVSRRISWAPGTLHWCRHDRGH